MDGVLIERARSGDADAFDELARARIDAVYRTAFAILGSAEDARDATQEALVAMWRNIGTLREPAAFDGWLHQITVNAARMAARRRGRRPREVQLIADDDDPRLAAQDSLHEQLAFDHAFDRLPIDQRALLVRHHLDGVSVAELAAELRVPEGTVKSRLHTARAAFERGLAEEHP